MPNKTDNPALSMSEDDLLKCVLELAKVLHWRTAHFRPAKTNRGWRTAVAGDGVGFPDLVLVRGSRCLFVELKSEKGKLSEEQETWINYLTAANQHDRVFVWRPADWLNGSIEEVLRR